MEKYLLAGLPIFQFHPPKLIDKQTEYELTVSDF